MNAHTTLIFVGAQTTHVRESTSDYLLNSNPTKVPSGGAGNVRPRGLNKENYLLWRKYE
jgi:hypothetical protein